MSRSFSSSSPPPSPTTFVAALSLLLALPVAIFSLAQRALVKPATLSSDVACAVCSKVVTESTPSCRGDDALQCDGCHLWFHRWCTGVSTCHYSSLSVSDVPFLCFVCLQKEFISLRDTVSALRLESAQLKSALSDIEANRVENPPDVENLSDGVTYAHVVSKSQLSSNNVPPSVPPNSEDRRCNLVISGIPECPQGTRQTSRALLDQDSIMSILSPHCPSLAIPSIKHFLRLGKYQPIRSRPILLKLHRPLDASVILSNVRRLSSSPGISIRRDLSSSDREVRSILLKERRSLLSSGVKPQDVRISASRLSDAPCMGKLSTSPLSVLPHPLFHHLPPPPPLILLLYSLPQFFLTTLHLTVPLALSSRHAHPRRPLERP